MLKIVPVIFVLLFSLPLKAQEAVVFIKNSEIKLNSYISYYLDSTGVLTINEIKGLSGKFQPMGEDDLRMGVGQAVAWLRLKIHNPSHQKEDAVIDFRDPSLLHLTLFQVNHDPLYSGTGIPQKDKNIKGNRNAFIMSLAPGETRDLLIRVSSKNFMTLTATLEDDEYFFQQSANEKVFFGFFYGILSLLFIYSIILFFLSRFYYFLFYGLYIVANALFTGAADGLMPQYFHSLVVWTRGYQEFIIAAVANILGLLFMRSYMNTRKWSPRLDKFLVTVIIGIFVTMLLVSIIDPGSGFIIMRVIGLFTLAIYLIGGYLGIKHKITGSYFFLVAFAVFGVFIVAFILTLFRVTPYSYFIQYSLHFGFLLSNVILSCALGVRIYYLYQDYLKEQKDKQQIIQQKNEELEIQVQERTAVLARKENQLRSILDNSTSNIWLVNKNYEALEFNSAFAGAWKTAYGHELKKGVSLMEQYQDEESKKIWKQRYKKIFAGNNVNTSDQYLIEGEYKTYGILGIPIRHERHGVELAAIFSTDITDRILYEEQLKKQNEDLRKVNQELDSFVYSASHDLKAPLSSLQGLIGLVRMEEDNSYRNTYYDMMEKSIKRLDQFIRDIIDYSRNTRVEIKYVEIDIRELIHSVLEDLQYMKHAADFKKDIQISEEVPFYHDTTRMRIIMRNLLSNAIRYGYKDEGEKRINITVDISNENLLLEVRDFGAGIEKDHQEKIFKMFYRAHESSDGTGLGLYIVKEALEKMGGTIELYSSTDGAAFRISVPNYYHNQN
jgi:PAS domain S-box-containing protein